MLYDSAARRQHLADQLEAVADTEAVEARILSETRQARPAARAVTAASTSAPKGGRPRARRRVPRASRRSSAVEVATVALAVPW